MDYLLGYQAIFADEEFGIIEDFFFNGAQQVLQIVDKNKIEYLVPFVDYYIDTILNNPGCVILKNALELIAFYRAEAKSK